MTVQTTIICPIIHNNGDRREVLEERLERAYYAVQAAMDALKHCAPNGRNFYPDPGRMERYEAQHRGRQEHLHAVAESLDAELAQMAEEARP